MKSGNASIHWQLWIVTICFFMQSLDSTIVNTALPSIAHSLHQNPLQMQSIVIIYVLTSAILLPASGWLADKFGIQHILMLAMIIFTLGSFCCARATTLEQLNFARTLQGIGGAMMVPVARLTVFRIVPRAQYIAAMSFVTLPGQIGPLIGPTLGGVLVEYASWHWIFLINLPVGILGVLAIFYLMPNHRIQTCSFDMLGYICMAIAMLALTLSLNSAHFRFSAMALSCLIFSFFVSLVGYYLHAKKHIRPLFSLAMFRIASFRVGLSGSFLGRIGSGSLPFLTPLFLQVGLGFSPLNTGLMMIPMVLGSIAMKPYVVKLVNLWGYRKVLLGSTAVLAIITFLLPLAGLHHFYYWFVLLLFIQGTANSLRFTTMNTLTLNHLSVEFSGGGNSLLSMIMQLSVSLGVTIAGLLLAIFTPPHTGSNLAGVHHAFLVTYWIITALMLTPLIIFMFAPQDSGENTCLNGNK